MAQYLRFLMTLPLLLFALPASSEEFVVDPARPLILPPQFGESRPDGPWLSRWRQIKDNKNTTAIDILHYSGLVMPWGAENGDAWQAAVDSLSYAIACDINDSQHELINVMALKFPDLVPQLKASLRDPAANNQSAEIILQNADAPPPLRQTILPQPCWPN